MRGCQRSQRSQRMDRRDFGVPEPLGRCQPCPRSPDIAYRQRYAGSAGCSFPLNCGKIQCDLAVCDHAEHRVVGKFDKGRDDFLGLPSSADSRQRDIGKSIGHGFLAHQETIGVRAGWRWCNVFHIEDNGAGFAVVKIPNGSNFDPSPRPPNPVHSLAQLSFGGPCGKLWACFPQQSTRGFPASLVRRQGWQPHRLQTIAARVA